MPIAPEYTPENDGEDGSCDASVVEAPNIADVLEFFKETNTTIKNLTSTQLTRQLEEMDNGSGFLIFWGLCRVCNHQAVEITTIKNKENQKDDTELYELECSKCGNYTMQPMPNEHIEWWQKD